VLNWIDDDTPLPPACMALGPDSDAPGLVAAGGNVTPERLNEAYRKGIYPWFSPGQPALWWSPDPRMVLPVADFKLSRSLRKTIQRFVRTPGCEVRFDSDFPQVIHHCATTPRDGQNGTWIVQSIADAYIAWHRAGCVHSAETWVNGSLVGGLYFVNIGRMVFGESMFAHRTDASKIALAALVAACRARSITLIDCQQNTDHLASFGGQEIGRSAFEVHLESALAQPNLLPWTYDESAWRLLLPPSSTSTEVPTNPAPTTASSTA